MVDPAGLVTAKWIFAIACCSSCGCSSQRHAASLLVPDGYRGVIRIVFDEPTGSELVFDKDDLVLRIPPSGTLRLRAKDEDVRGQYVISARTYSGRPLPDQLGMNFLPNDLPPPPGPVRAFMSRMNGIKEWLGYVGSDHDRWQDKKALEALYG